MTWTTTPGQRNEATQVRALLEQGAVRRRRGRPRVRPKRVAGDKAYTGRPVRSYRRKRKIGAVIARLKTEKRQGTRFDTAAYRKRNVVERTINRFKQDRAIATRYDKLQVRYHAMLTIVATFLWI